MLVAIISLLWWWGSEPPIEGKSLGPWDERVLAALHRELASGDSEVRFTGAFHLGNLATNWIDDPVRRTEIVSTLTRLLDDPADNVRATAAIGLGNLGKFAQPAGPAILRRIADDDVSRAPTTANLHFNRQ